SSDTMNCTITTVASTAAGLLVCDICLTTTRSEFTHAYFFWVSITAPSLAWGSSTTAGNPTRPDREVPEIAPFGGTDELSIMIIFFINWERCPSATQEMRMDDFYSPVAEFYDLVPRAHAEGEAALRKILAEVDPDAGTVVDIGAGTGRTCRIVAEVLPSAKSLACEPAPAMRAGPTHDV